MSVFAIDLLWAYQSMPRLLFDLFMLGFSAGFYDIPLMALLQWRSPPSDRGRVMATINFFSFIAILVASAALWVMHGPLHLNAAQVFCVLGVLSLAGIMLLCAVFPEARQRATALLRNLKPSSPLS